MVDSLEYQRLAHNMEEFQYRKGRCDGIEDTMDLIHALLGMAEEETQLVEIARKAANMD